MIDIQKQITHRLDGAREDWSVADNLVQQRRTRHGLFFAHVALEKALKAHVCRNTHELAPRIHNLVRLAELANLNPSQSQIDTLADLNAFNLEGRYPDALSLPPTPQEAVEYLSRAEEVLQWLINQL